MSNHLTWLRERRAWLLVGVAMLALLFPTSVRAAEDNGFNIQVSPSPLVITLTPGKRQTATITVRNLSTHPETLVPQLSGFSIGANSEKIDLKSEVPYGLDRWVSFKQSTLTIAPGGSQPLDVIYNTPTDVGFSYALAITLNQTGQKSVTQGAALKGSVTVFNLINIDRNDAKRQLSIEKFASNRSRYEYLPASFAITLKNAGNIIDQPQGNIFIQRSFDDAKPLATIPVNPASRYILPDTTRTLTAEWNDGFPHYVSKDGQSKLSWQWNKLGSLRIGKYIAKIVIIYNDGQRDVPVTQSTSFWVIPWKLILGTLVIGGLVVTGLIAWIRLVVKGTSKVRKYAHRK